MVYIGTHQGRTTKAKVVEPRPGIFTVTLGEAEYHVDFLEPQPNIYSLIIDGRSFEVDVDARPDGDVFDVFIKGDHYEVEMVEEKKKKLAMKMSKGATGRQDMKSPMAGNVRAVLVQPGDRVVAGQVVLILEAMKMQNELKSAIDGIVASVTAREGVAVAAGDPLLVVEPWEPQFPTG
ncbi:biotin/lipoyl-containing protein [Geothrix sp. 21YS21S-2]|uniref:biotin/lipoyl-containing protein n=1 Tax=Geothrix sp. 21YS21S-2 TaxID=3068893 RepID=UPI0027B97FAA|nr:biotin/lipoyl-containing protein [Geothrix sp. 21YS21S-2]